METQNKKKNLHRVGLTSVLSIVLVVITIVLCGLAFFLTLNMRSGKAVKIFGRCIMRVATGSMEPALQTGDFIHIEESNPEQLKEGDIIAFYSRLGETKDFIIVHRIYERKEDGSFVTRGDSNGVSDEEMINREQIVGKFKGKAEFLIWLSGFGDFRKMAILSIMIVILIVAMYETRTIMSLGKQMKEEKTYEERMRAAIEEEKKRIAIEEEKKGEK